jgi:hypothetical protein
MPSKEKQLPILITCPITVTVSLLNVTFPIKLYLNFETLPVKQTYTLLCLSISQKFQISRILTAWCHWYPCSLIMEMLCNCSWWFSSHCSWVTIHLTQNCISDEQYLRYNISQWHLNDYITNRMSNSKVVLLQRTAFFWVIKQREVVISCRLFGTTWQSHPQGSTAQKKACRNYHYLLCNNPERRSSQLLCGESLKSRIVLLKLAHTICGSLCLPSNTSVKTWKHIKNFTLLLLQHNPAYQVC